MGNILDKLEESPVDSDTKKLVAEYLSSYFDFSVPTDYTFVGNDAFKSIKEFSSTNLAREFFYKIESVMGGLGFFLASKEHNWLYYLSKIRDRYIACDFYLHTQDSDNIKLYCSTSFDGVDNSCDIDDIPQCKIKCIAGLNFKVEEIENGKIISTNYYDTKEEVLERVKEIAEKENDAIITNLITGKIKELEI